LIDLGILGHIHFTGEFFLGLFSIVVIDLILAGDNAVVIAMAVRSLAGPQRMTGIVVGAGAAVVLRVILTFFAAQLLAVEYVKFVGGILILWIALKLFVEGTEGHGGQCREARTLGQAIWIIIVADVTMSLDNILAVAGASRGNLFLLLFGLGLSIPLVVFTSNILSKLMDRYPVIVYIGAAVLGRVGGEMMISDPAVIRLLDPSAYVRYAVEAFFTVGVIVAGVLWMRYRARNGKETAAEPPGEEGR